MPNKIPFSESKFKQLPIVGIVRGIEAEAAKWVAETYLSCGFYTLEITMNTPGAAEIISTLAKEFPELNIGAGTVCNIEDYQKAKNAGSQFMVTPIIDEEVISTSVKESIPIFPGAYTPTEIYKAWSLGATAVKVFPATQLGVKYVKDLMGPLNTIKLLPTGGVSKENIQSFFKANVYGVGMGGSLLPKEILASKDLRGLKSHFQAIKGEIQNFLP